jgi:hypothetical protein
MTTSAAQPPSAATKNLSPSEICRHSGEFASRDASVRSMPSASAMSVTVAPEARALAIRARRHSRRSSVVGLGCSLIIARLRLLTHANRHKEKRLSFSAIAVPCRISSAPRWAESFDGFENFIRLATVQ